MLDEAVLQILTATYFSGSLVVFIAHLMLYARDKRSYLINWAFSYGMLTVAYLMVFFSFLGLSVFFLTLFSIGFLVAAYYFLKAVYYYLNKQSFRYLNLSVVFSIAVLVLLLAFDLPAFIYPVYVYFISGLYFMVSGFLLSVKYKKAPQSFIGIIIIFFGLTLVFNPVFSANAFFLGLATSLLTFLGFSLSIGVFVLHLEVVGEEQNYVKQQLYYMSFHDSLTDLYNRAYVDSMLADVELKNTVPFSVINADLNNLKVTNDTHGHHAGDLLLLKFAEVLRSQITAENAIISRYGGDEYIVLLPGVDEAGVDKLMENIRSAVKKVTTPYDGLSISMGHATRTSKEEALHNIVENADKHMYDEKSESSDKCQTQ